MMGKKCIYSLILIALFAIGCGDQSARQVIRLTDYPNQVTPGEAFSVSGEYVTNQPETSRQITIQLTVNSSKNQLLYSQEIVLPDRQQSFTFPEITLGDLNDGLYFELLLIKEGQYTASVDSSSNPTQIAHWHTNIITTYFNPEGKTTWGYDLADENPFYFALPYRDFYYYVWDSAKKERVLKKKDYFGVTDVKNRWIEIYHPQTDTYAYAQWVDVGPWNYYDPYYVFGKNDERPYAEIGIDMGWSDVGYRETNGAGLDISPTVMRFLNDQALPGIINVNWRFIDDDQVPEGPWLNRISVTSAQAETFNRNTIPLRTRDN